MTHQEIKKTFNDAVDSVVSNISEYTFNPGKELVRPKKLPADKLISFLVSEGSKSTTNELLEFFEHDPLSPTDSAFNQQRAKLKPEALEAVLKNFNSAINSIENNLRISTEQKSKYKFLAHDGTSVSFFSKPQFASSEYHVSQGHSKNGFYNMHLNAMYDLEKHTFTDAIIQPIHDQNEFQAFCNMVDRQVPQANVFNVYICDRGTCSYNTMAHVQKKEQYFLFRAKDIHSKGMLHRFDFPKEESFDITVKVNLVRSNSKEIQINEGYKRYIDKKTSFDFLEPGSLKIFELTFRIIRFPISDSSYECIVTNLPADEFTIPAIKELYNTRWGIETSFRGLKYTIGLSNFHAYKPEYVKQEIWARLIAFNITATTINHTVIDKKETKYDYKVNFSVAANTCLKYFRLNKSEDSIDVMAILKKKLVLIREGRKYPRLQIAHFRKPKYFIYRAA